MNYLRCTTALTLCGFILAGTLPSMAMLRTAAGGAGSEEANRAATALASLSLTSGTGDSAPRAGGAAAMPLERDEAPLPGSLFTQAETDALEYTRATLEGSLRFGQNMIAGLEDTKIPVRMRMPELSFTLIKDGKESNLLDTEDDAFINMVYNNIISEAKDEISDLMRTKVCLQKLCMQKEDAEIPKALTMLLMSMTRSSAFFKEKAHGSTNNVFRKMHAIIVSATTRLPAQYQSLYNKFKIQASGKGVNKTFTGLQSRLKLKSTLDCYVNNFPLFDGSPIAYEVTEVSNEFKKLETKLSQIHSRYMEHSAQIFPDSWLSYKDFQYFFNTYWPLYELMEDDVALQEKDARLTQKLEGLYTKMVKETGIPPEAIESNESSDEDFTSIRVAASKTNAKAVAAQERRAAKAAAAQAFRAAEDESAKERLEAEETMRKISEMRKQAMAAAAQRDAENKARVDAWRTGVAAKRAAKAAQTAKDQSGPTPTRDIDSPPSSEESPPPLVRAQPDWITDFARAPEPDFETTLRSLWALPHSLVRGFSVDEEGKFSCEQKIDVWLRGPNAALGKASLHKPHGAQDSKGNMAGWVINIKGALKAAGYDLTY